VHSLSLSLSLLPRIQYYIDTHPNANQLPNYHTTMFKMFLLIFAVLFLIFSFSTVFAHPIPISTSGRRNLMLMGRVANYPEHGVTVAMTPTLRDSDEPLTTRAHKFRHRLIHQQRMQMGTE
jgi:hypothetical protein